MPLTSTPSRLNGAGLQFVRLIRQKKPKKIYYTDLVDLLMEAIEGGILSPGDRLIPQRQLAYEINVAVGTVSRAYTEATRRGLVVGEIGRGTYIASLSSPKSAAGDVDSNGNANFTHNRLPVDGYVGEFCGSLAYIAKRPNVAAMLDYPRDGSDVHFRTVAANWISTVGMDVSPNSVIVCNGVQHGLAVILGVLCMPGDLIVAEELNYPGLRLLGQTYHLRLKGVAMDAYGMIPEALEEVCRAEKPKFVFIQPTVHNPTAAVVPIERRARIAEIVERHDLTLIEDDIYAFLPETPMKPISALIPDRSYYVTGTSKTLGAGIRVGYIVAPPASVHKLTAMVHATTWIPAPFMVEIASRWMVDGTAKRIIDSHRQSARQRQQIVAEALQGFNYRSQDTSFHLWLELPRQWRHDEFVFECLDGGLAVSSSQGFVVAENFVPAAVRICLGGFRTMGRLESNLAALRSVLQRSPRHSAVV